MTVIYDKYDDKYYSRVQTLRKDICEGCCFMSGEGDCEMPRKLHLLGCHAPPKPLTDSKYYIWKELDPVHAAIIIAENRSKYEQA